MPQLDFSMYASQALWMIFFFLMLWLGLSLFVTPKIAEVHEWRKRLIHEYLRKAENANGKAQSTLQKYEAAIADANKKALSEMERRQEEIRSYVSEAEAQTAAKLNQQIASGEFLLAKEKQETLLQVEQISRSLAFDIIRRLGLKQISEQDIEQVATEENR